MTYLLDFWLERLSALLLKYDAYLLQGTLNVCETLAMNVCYGSLGEGQRFPNLPVFTVCFCCLPFTGLLTHRSSRFPV